MVYRYGTRYVFIKFCIKAYLSVTPVTLKNDNQKAFIHLNHTYKHIKINDLANEMSSIFAKASFNKLRTNGE